MKYVGADWSYSDIAAMKKEKYKIVVKKNIIQSAFKFLQSKKITHSKVQHIDYSTLQIAPYLMDANFLMNRKFFCIAFELQW